MRDDVIPTTLAGTGIDARVGGLTASFLDQNQTIADRLPLFIGAVVGLSLILLLVVFRSVLVAAKAGIMNLLSVFAAYGVVSLAANGGWLGELFGIHEPTPVPGFIPLMMFAILFGLSMDYEVFLLSRIREEHNRSGDNSRSVADGLAATARVITAAAAIMVAVFGAFVPSDQVFLKLIGLGMASAILLDATVVRMVLVPASMQLLGERNWWLPHWLDRVLPNLDVDAPSDVTALAETNEPAAEPVAA
jgi:RND superfamily putative drug exporter